MKAVAASGSSAVDGARSSKPDSANPAFARGVTEYELAVVPRLTVPVRLFSCPLCRYWLYPDDEHCPDCGAKSQHPRARWSRPLVVRWRKLGAGAGGIAGFALTIAAIPIGVGWLVLPPMLAGVGVFVGNEKGQANVRRAILFGRATGSLQDTAAKLRRLIVECDGLLARSAAARATAERILTGDKLTAALELSDETCSARMAAQDRYTVALWNVYLARFLNRLVPIVEALNSLSWDDSENAVVYTEQLHALGSAMLKCWSSERTANAELGRRFFARFEEALEGVSEIRGEIAQRRVRLADPGASNLDDADRGMSLVLRRELARYREMTQEIAAGKFSLGADEIDHALARLDEEKHLQHEMDAADGD